MKKILFCFLILMMLVVYKPVFASDYDSKLLTDAKAFTEMMDFSNKDVNPFYDGNYYFSVKENAGIYEVDVNGLKETVYTPYTSSLNPKIIPPSDLINLSPSDKKLISNCQKKIYDYIDSSSVLTDKKSIKYFISTLLIKKVSNSENTSFDSSSNIIYINQLSELAIIKEYIKALLYYTRNTTYCELIDEAFIDLISDTLVSDHENQLYAPIIYPYIDFLGLDSIKSFYYGYDKIDSVDKNELNLLVLSINNIFVDNYSVYYNNIIYKWYATFPIAQ